MEAEDFEVRLGDSGITLEYPVMLGAGVCRDYEGPEGIRAISRSAAAAVVVGSITQKPRAGNSGETFQTTDIFSFNSRGLPNRGQEFYKQELPAMVSILHNVGKPMIVSVAGFSPQEYAELAVMALKRGADIVEVNVSCPNVRGRIVCYDTAYVLKILQAVRKTVGDLNQVSVKLSPIFDIVVLREIVKIIQKMFIKIVVVSNTLPYTLAYDRKTGLPLITAFPDGLAAMGGEALKPVALGQVRLFRGMLPDDVTIIGSGGVQTGEDVLDYLRTGASAVQVVTAFLKQGNQVFLEIQKELIDLMMP